MQISSLFRTSSFALLALICAWPASLLGDDKVFSGPQAGEKTTPFKVADLTGSVEAKDRDVIAENKGAPTVLVFLHGLERSLVPLLTTIDQYGVEHKDQLKTEVVFLSSDRLSGEQRLKAAANSLKLKARWGVSLDGAEGPGNYGLNKECLMTVVVAKENKVTANFALMQPGIADAPKIITALAQVIGDNAPLTAEALQARRGGRTAAMAAEGRPAARERAAAGASGKTKEEFPGKPPSDGKMMGLLRRFIQPTNEDAAVDQVLKEVNEYIEKDPAMRQQAIDGWTRVLHFETYGTAYSRKQGRAALENWKKPK